MIIGITGGIAAGKSEISKYLTSKGYYVICADDVGRDLCAKGNEALLEIERVFGSEYLTVSGELNRPKLAETVFADPYQLIKLNSIMWGKIKTEIERRIEAYFKHHNEGSLIFVDAALLIEARLTHTVDCIWLVVADEEIRIQRIMDRSHFSEETARLRMKAQMKDDDRREYASVVFYNNGTIDELLSQVDKHLKTIL